MAINISKNSIITYLFIKIKILFNYYNNKLI